MCNTHHHSFCPNIQACTRMCSLHRWFRHSARCACRDSDYKDSSRIGNRQFLSGGICYQIDKDWVYKDHALKNQNTNYKRDPLVTNELVKIPTVSSQNKWWSVELILFVVFKRDIYIYRRSPIRTNSWPKMCGEKQRKIAVFTDFSMTSTWPSIRYTTSQWVKVREGARDNKHALNVLQVRYWHRKGKQSYRI